MHDHLFADRPWRKRSESPVRGLVGMLGCREANLFHDLAAIAWTGRGTIVDAGSFLGKSATAFALGMRANPAFRAGEHRIHCFDDFVCHDQLTVGLIRSGFGDEARVGDSTRPWFDRQVQTCDDLLTVHEGDLNQATWPEQPIELLMVDIAKSVGLGRRVADLFYRCLIPGVSLVAHQDYHHVWLPHIHVTMEFLQDSFELVEPGVDSTAVFAMTRAIEPSRLQRAVDFDFTPDEQLQLMASAVGRLPSHLRAHARLAQVTLRHLLDVADDSVAEFETVVAEHQDVFADKLPRDCEDLRRHLLLTDARRHLQQGDVQRALQSANRLDGDYEWHAPLRTSDATDHEFLHALDNDDVTIPTKRRDALAELLRAEIMHTIGKHDLTSQIVMRELIEHHAEIVDQRPHFDLLCSLWEAADAPAREQEQLDHIARAQPDQPEVEALGARRAFRRGDLKDAARCLHQAVERGLPERRADDLLAPLGMTWQSFRSQQPKPS